MRAHLLLQVEPGRVAEAARWVGAVPGVAQACGTSGAFDVIAVVDDASEPALARTLRHVRQAPGLWTLRVCRSTS